MPCRLLLSAVVVAITAVTAQAADLPTQSRLGAIFAEPAEGLPPPKLKREREAPAPVIPYTMLPDPVWNRGGSYYGSSWSYYNPGAYYGGPYVSYAVRLPYVCGLYGYCN
jgi:hypothetical protein